MVTFKKVVVMCNICRERLEFVCDSVALARRRARQEHKWRYSSQWGDLCSNCKDKKEFHIRIYKQ